MTRLRAGRTRSDFRQEQGFCNLARTDGFTVDYQLAFARDVSVTSAEFQNAIMHPVHTLRRFQHVLLLIEHRDSVIRKVRKKCLLPGQ